MEVISQGPEYVPPLPKQDRLLSVLRWLVLIPTSAFVMKVFLVLGSVALFFPALFFGFLWCHFSGIEQFCALALCAGATVGAIAGAVMVYLMAPAGKDKVCRFAPAVLVLLYFAEAIVVRSENGEAHDASVPFLLLSLIAAAVLSSGALFNVLKPATVVSVLRKVFRDELSEFDKSVLILQLGFLITVNSFWVECLFTSGSDVPGIEFAYMGVVLLAAIAMPFIHMRYGDRLTQQGRDDSKLLNVINAVTGAPVLLWLLFAWRFS